MVFFRTKPSQSSDCGRVSVLSNVASSGSSGLMLAEGVIGAHSVADASDSLCRSSLAESGHAVSFSQAYGKCKRRLPAPVLGRQISALR